MVARPITCECEEGPDGKKLEEDVRCYSLMDVARLLGVKLSTVRYLINEKELRAFKPGNKSYVVSHADLKDFVSRKRKEAADDDVDPGFVVDHPVGNRSPFN